MSERGCRSRHAGGGGSANTREDIDFAVHIVSQSRRRMIKRAGADPFLRFPLFAFSAADMAAINVRASEED